MSTEFDELNDDEPNIMIRSPSTISYRSTKNLVELKYDEISIVDQNTKPLSLLRKLFYAVGGIPYQMCGSAIGLFIPVFLLEVARLRPAQTSIVLFTAKAWDAISDPVIGYFVSKTNTRFGKLRPWILFSAPFAIVCYMMIWYVPDIHKNLKTVWYVVFFCLFQTFLSCLHVPYTSLTMFLTHSQAERDSITSFRMFFEVFGVFLAASIEGLIISLYTKKNPCDDIPRNYINNTNLDQHFADIYNQNISTTTKSHTPSNKVSGEEYLISAGMMSIIYILCSTTTFFGTKEIKDTIVDKDEIFIKSMKKVFSHKSYRSLLAIFLFNSLATQLLQTNIALYCKYSVDAKTEFQFIIIVLLISSIISLPFWQFMILKKGKKTTYATGLIIFIPMLFTLLFLEEPVWLLYIIAVVTGLAIAVNFLLPWSMLPDVIDEFMLLNGERKESIFYSFFVFFNKLASGFAIALSTLVLEFVGYKECSNNCCIQPASVGLTIRMLVVPGPVILILISLMIIWKHSIDEKRRQFVKENLSAIRQRK